MHSALPLAHCMSTVNGLLILRQAIAGDVVISHSPQNPRHVVCKRVLGLAGDTVQVARTSQHGPTSVQVLPALTAWRLAPLACPTLVASASNLPRVFTSSACVISLRLQISLRLRDIS